MYLIFKSSVETGQLPKVWKNANITAIYKKGDKKEAGNYRPVSLTCIVCKVLESIIREKIVDHMNTYKLFSKKQFGFLSGRSTMLQLLKVLDRWTEILDNGNCIDVAYCDFMKAFDTVPHQRLLHKLRMYGIGPKYIKWLSAFLVGREQRVIVKGEPSTKRSVTSGIPQGSVMGPILFVLYINDLPEALKFGSELYLYADDTKVFREICSQDDCITLQRDIKLMQEWSEKWLLKFHPEKCKTMRIGRSKVIDFEYKLKESMNPMEKSEAEKDVGVVIDENLNFERHMNEKINKANAVLGAIRRTFQYLDKITFKMLYTSMVRPILEYANPVWCPYKLKHVDMLENVQRRATKLIPGMKDMSYSERLEKLNLPSLSYRRHRGDLIEVYKILTDKYDREVSSNFFELRYEGTTRGHSLKIYKERSRLNIRKYSFKNRIVDIWNTLPQKIVECPTVMSFERNLDKYWNNQDKKFIYRENLCISATPVYYETIEEGEELAARAESGLLTAKNEELTLQATTDLLSEEDL